MQASAICASCYTHKCHKMTFMLNTRTAHRITAAAVATRTDIHQQWHVAAPQHHICSAALTSGQQPRNGSCTRRPGRGHWSSRTAHCAESAPRAVLSQHLEPSHDGSPHIPSSLECLHHSQSHAASCAQHKQAATDHYDQYQSDCCGRSLQPFNISSRLMYT